MAGHGSSGAGGPLLRVTDMLHDLAEDELISEPVGGNTSSSSPPSSDQKSNSRSEGPEVCDLPAAFEDTYNELCVALTQSGHSWTGLTQELCATLTTADKLVATSQLNLVQLPQEIKKLEKVVKRGQAAVTSLQIAIGQVGERVPVS